MSAALFSMMPNPAPMPVAEPSVLGQLATFVAIGAAGAGSFVALSSLATALTGSQSAWLNALCYAALIGPVYLAHRRFSFQSDVPHIQALPRYVGVQVMAMALIALFSYVVYSVLGVTSVVGTTLVIALTSGLNFAVLRFWAFAHRAPIRVLALRPMVHE